MSTRWDYIEGPVSAYLWEGSDGRKIWLFGDRHVTTSGCITRCVDGRVGRLEHVIANLADDFEVRRKVLHVLVERSQVTLPVFEEGQETHIQFSGATYMDTLNTFLFGCHGCSSACYYPNVRFHATDARQTHEPFNAIMQVATGCSSAFFQKFTSTDDASDHVSWSDVPNDVIDRIYEEDLTKEDLETVAWALGEYTGEETVSDLFLRTMEIVGVLGVIEETSQKDFFVQYIREQLDGITPDLAGFFRRRLADIDVNDRRGIVTFLCDWMDAADLLMDTYTLAKILVDGLESAIVLCGFVHVDTLNGLMEKLGFTLLFSHEISGDQCLDMRGAPHPLL